MSRSQIEQWAQCALDLLEQYRDYAEKMRMHGRGFTPTTRNGMHPDHVCDGLSDALDVPRMGWHQSRGVMAPDLALADRHIQVYGRPRARGLK